MRLKLKEGTILLLSCICIVLYLKIIKNSAFQDLTEGKLRFGTTDSYRVKMWQHVVEKISNQTKQKRLPDLIGIGVEKCGTHALHQFLSVHPLIRYNITKIEAHFFDGKRKNLSSYREKMPFAERDAVVMEKTPAYFSFPPYEVPKLMREKVPGAKLLLVLCDPVKRAFSDFVHEGILRQVIDTKSGIERFKEFDEYLDEYIPLVEGEITKWSNPSGKNNEEMHASREIINLHRRNYLSTILTTGLYSLHLRRWLQHYNHTNLMIIDGEEMFVDPGAVIERTQKFSGIPSLVSRRDFERDPKTGYFCYKDWQNGGSLECLPPSKTRTRGGKRQMSSDAASRLKEFYRKPNQDLFRLLGRSFNWS